MISAGDDIDRHPARREAFGEGFGREAGPAAAGRILVVEQQHAHRGPTAPRRVVFDVIDVSGMFGRGRGKRYATGRMHR